MFLLRNIDVVTYLLKPDTKTAETIRNNAKIVIRNILYRNLTPCHGGHSNKATNLNHVRKYCMRTTFQFLYPLNSKQIRCNTRYFCPHTVKHLAQLLQIRLAGSIINSCHSFCKHGSHDYIGSTCHRSLIKQHICSFQLISRECINAAFCIIVK